MTTWEWIGSCQRARYRFFFATIMRDGKDLEYSENCVIWGRRVRWLLLAVAVLMGALAVRGDFVVAPVSSLGVPDLVGANSSAPLILGSDGAFYGTTYGGGGAVRGTVFKLSSDGAELQVLRRFTGLSGDGAKAYGGVIEASNGLLYGLTSEGGISNQGTIFRLGRDGSGYQVLHRFTGTAGRKATELEV